MRPLHKKGMAFALALLIPLAVLGGLAFKPLMATARGEEILVATDTYDPRDLFRGDYVHLNLAIGRGNYGQLSGAILEEPEAYNGKFVYVLLEADETGKFGVSEILPKPPKEGIYLKAKISGLYNKPDMPEVSVVFLNYGLERYYVQENTGTQMQYDSNEGALNVRVRVYRGYGYIAGIEKSD